MPKLILYSTDYSKPNCFIMRRNKRHFKALLLALAVSTMTTFAQTLEQKQQISKQYNQAKLTRLKQDFKKREDQRKADVMNMAAMILGMIKKEAELIPMISKASICSVTRMVPISEVMLDPTLPAKIKAIMVGENSKMIDWRAAYPTV